jgi:hypothetical protein
MIQTLYLTITTYELFNISVYEYLSSIPFFCHLLSILLVLSFRTS